MNAANEPAGEIVRDLRAEEMETWLVTSSARAMLLDWLEEYAALAEDLTLRDAYRTIADKVRAS